MSTRSANAAFFDVDETVIAAKSMFDFLRFWTAQCGDHTGYGPDGRLTGEVRQPMIGAAKAAAVRDVIASLGLAAEECHGYGDHASDLEMLLEVGHPVVVGADPVLRDHAARRGWRVLSADTGPASAVDVTPDEPGPTTTQPTGTAIARPIG